MNPEFFHDLFELIDRDPKGALVTAVGLVVVLTFFVAGTLWKVHPVVLWLAFTAMTFGLSQCIPEFRNGKVPILNFCAVSSAIATTSWFWLVAPCVRRMRRGP